MTTRAPSALDRPADHRGSLLVAMFPLLLLAEVTQAAETKPTSAMPADMALTLADALRLLDESPAMALARVEETRAQAEVLAARAYPNPTVSYGGVFHVHGRDNFDGTQHDVTVEQPLWLSGQRSARQDAAKASVRAARADTLARRHALEFVLHRQFVAALAAGLRAEILREGAEDVARMTEIVRGRHEAGDRSRYDVVRLEAELAVARSNVSEAEADERASVFELGTLLGRPGWAPKLVGTLVEPSPNAGSEPSDGVDGVDGGENASAEAKRGAPETTPPVPGTARVIAPEARHAAMARTGQPGAPAIVHLAPPATDPPGAPAIAHLAPSATDPPGASDTRHAAMATAVHPAVEAARRSLDAAEMAYGVAIRERSLVPALTTGLVATSREYGSALVLGLSLPLPIFDRAQGLIGAAVADRAIARAQLKAVETTLAAELARAEEVARLRQGALETFEVHVFGRLAQIRDMAEASYRAGQSSVVELLDALTTVRDLRIERLERQVAVREAKIDRLEASASSGGRALPNTP